MPENVHPFITHSPSDVLFGESKIHNLDFHDTFFSTHTVMQCVIKCLLRNNGTFLSISWWPILTVASVGYDKIVDYCDNNSNSAVKQYSPGAWLITLSLFSYTLYIKNAVQRRIMHTVRALLRFSGDRCSDFTTVPIKQRWIIWVSRSYWSINITMTLLRTLWRLKSPALRLFIRLFIQAQINENIKAPRLWPLWGEFTVDQWISRAKGQ